MTLFVDTSAILAFLNREDRYHAPALALWRQLLAGDEQLHTNNYILVETMALTQHRFGLEATRRLQSELLPVLAVSWVDEVIHGQATAALLAANRRHLSLVDCSAMATMRLLGINRIFTFDRHFADYGFALSPAQA